MLEPTDIVQNHMQTIHASAQFTLAETQSGLYLQHIFPELENQAVALLRSSTVKFKNPATSTLVAHASVEEEQKNKFMKQFEKKGRASIVVDIELRDENDAVTMVGNFSWYVQRSK